MRSLALGLVILCSTPAPAAVRADAPVAGVDGASESGRWYASAPDGEATPATSALATTWARAVDATTSALLAALRDGAIRVWFRSRCEHVCVSAADR